MADDYLGKKMADHEQMRMAPKRAARKCVAVPPNAYPNLRALVDNGLLPKGEEAVRALRAVGAKVAFIADDAARGARLAQESGARCYPCVDFESALADLNAHWGGVDIVVRVNQTIDQSAIHSID